MDSALPPGHHERDHIITRPIPFLHTTASKPSPPPLNTAVPSSGLKVQWHSLQYNLHERAIPERQSTHDAWLKSVDMRILLTALAKQRAELELLQLEASERRKSSSSGIHFPNYSSAYGGVEAAPTPQTPLLWHSFSESAVTKRDASITSAEMLFMDTSRGYNPPLFSTSNIGITENEYDVSPLSPTFGPRQNTLFTGTVSRRRSSQLSSPLSPTFPIPSTSIKNQNASGNSSRRSSIVEVEIAEKRIQFEAAWIEIERNLGSYVDRFSAAEGTGAGIDRVPRGREEVWKELVVLRDRARVLRERLRGASALRS